MSFDTTITNTAFEPSAKDYIKKTEDLSHDSYIMQKTAKTFAEFGKWWNFYDPDTFSGEWQEFFGNFKIAATFVFPIKLFGQVANFWLSTSSLNDARAENAENLDEKFVKWTKSGVELMGDVARMKSLFQKTPFLGAFSCATSLYTNVADLVLLAGDLVINDRTADKISKTTLGKVGKEKCATELMRSNLLKLAKIVVSIASNVFGLYGWYFSCEVAIVYGLALSAASLATGVINKVYKEMMTANLWKSDYTAKHLKI